MNGTLSYRAQGVYDALVESGETFPVSENLARKIRGCGNKTIRELAANGVVKLFNPLNLEASGICPFCNGTGMHGGMNTFDPVI